MGTAGKGISEFLRLGNNKKALEKVKERLTEEGRKRIGASKGYRKKLDGGIEHRHYLAGRKHVERKLKWSEQKYLLSAVERLKEYFQLQETKK
ncbi:MAG: hypothetical protein ACOCZM_02515 [Bacillota bacterium]